MEKRRGAKRPEPPGKLVLVVDDAADFRDIISITVRKEGYRAAVADGVDEATAQLDVEAPDLIVLDLMMPRQSGYEFLRQLQATGRGKIPVFVVSARAMDASTVEMIRQEGNVVEFFAKPFAMAEFVAALHRHLKPYGSVSR